ncbi:hypothetical protein LTR33_011004 [Friedmanniomyces endolithicus]|nr:hypothetical protein LTR33_011004 [Friedmanniomyces endolithicus]
MSSPLKNIAIVGASGSVGTFITKALISQGQHNVTAITRGHKPVTPRNKSAQMPEGLHAIKEVDYDSHESLVGAMKGQDMLIITMNVMAPRDSQTKLIDAAIEAGIHWIMPNQYGGYFADDETNESGRADMLRAGTMAVRRYIEGKGGSWIVVACGFWYEFSLSGQEYRYGFDFEKKNLTLFDDGEVKHTCSTWPQVGRAVAKLLALPVSGASPCLNDWKNNQVVFSSFALSQRDMLASVLRVTGDKESDWKITHEGTEERYKRGQEMFKQGNIAGFGIFLYVTVFFPDGKGDLTALRENEKLGLPEEDLDEATKVAVEAEMATGKQPAVVIIARHGPRLDAADQTWHLSTPTPYDPPLTYGGWNQCRNLGIRIAKLLQAREQAAEDAESEPGQNDGVTAHDFAQQQQQHGKQRIQEGEYTWKRKRKHKVVIHTSPFLRCVQSSVAIAAGMAQHQTPSSQNNSRPTARSRTPNTLHSASPRVRAMEGIGSPTLAPISEPRQVLAHAIARRALSEHRRHSRFKLRVDAFLGEWLNPQYFEQITPPPPSAMMVATAKAELMQHEVVDIFSPTLSTKSSGGDLWGAHTRLGSRDDALEDWSDVHDTLATPVPERDRASSVSSVGSNESGASGRKSPLRSGHVLQPLTSTVPKPEASFYVPPTPHYAVSTSDHIPRGYVSHARQACVNADYAWDSSRPPQDWGDGGEYGEEWSGMHKRFRRGLNHLIRWYSQHNADDRAEDALGLEQAEHQLDHEEDEDEEEQLVLILVTHGAGCNALIGALTGQPVLLDVGTASLTMAVRRENAPLDIMPRRVSDQDGPLDGYHARRSSLDMGLSTVYEMKFVNSSEHLMRPSVREQGGRSASHNVQRSTSQTGGPPLRTRTGTANSSLGSMLRPSAAAPQKMKLAGSGVTRSNTMPVAVGGRVASASQAGESSEDQRSPSSGVGLWTPATTTRESMAPAIPATNGREDTLPTRDMPSTSGTSPAASITNGTKAKESAPTPAQPPPSRPETSTALDGPSDGFPDPSSPPSQRYSSGTEPSPPQQLINRASSQPSGGLWGAKPGNAGQRVARMFGR